MVALAACGGGGGGGAQASPGSAPRYGGTLVMASNSDPGPLNPGITTSVPTHVVTGPMFNGLVGIDQNLKPLPDLATSWDTAADGKTVTFHLASGVTWHDGHAFSSADVKFTFEKILLPFSSRTKSALGPVLAGIDVPDTNTVVFRFKTPYAAFLSLIEKVNAPIMPMHIYQGTDPMTNPANQRPVGTGAFKFQEGVKGDHYTMVRNDRYFKKGQPYLDKVVIRIIPDNSTASAAFERGEVDYLVFPAGQDLDRLAKLPGVTQTNKGREAFASVTFLVFNLDRTPLKDVRVRQAIGAAVDQKFIISSVLAGKGIATSGPISPQLKPFYSSADAKQPAFDPAQAKQLLSQAGVSNLKLTWVGDPSVSKLAAVLKDELAQVGITLEIVQLERNAWIDRLYNKRDFDLSYTNFENGPDPDIGVKRAFISSNIGPVSFSNAAAYRNTTVDELLTRAATATDPKQRQADYAQFQKIVSQELPYLYPYQTDSGVLFKSDYKGICAVSGKCTIYYEDTWWAKGTAKPSPGT
jgi:peptide/nickel transport system substrate-binding protein